MTETRISPRALLGWCAALSAGALSITRIGDYDIWYHLRAGRLFLESGGLPATDPFAYTAASQPLSVQSWLAAVLYHLAERAGGIPGVQIFNAAVVAAAFGLLFATTRLFSKGRGDAALSVVLILLAAFAARFRLGARPHVLELLLLATDLYVLQRLRTRGRAPLWILPLVQLVWVNVHGSHLLGIALPFLFLCGEAVQRRVPARWRADAAPAAIPSPRSVWTLAAAGAACAMASLANPQGWRALQFPFLVAGMRGYMARIGEWQPMSWELLVGFGARYTWAFSALVVLALLGLAAARRVAVTDLLLLAVFGVLAARGVRLAPEFAIATVPGTFAALAPLAVRLSRGREDAVAWGSLAGLLVALSLSPLDHAYEYGFGKKERIFPDRAVDFAERTGVSGPVFNSFAFGDFLVHRAPDRKVFIHGRNEVFPESFYEQFVAAHRDAAVFRDLVERWGIEWILLEYTLTDYGRREEMPHLGGNPEWAPVYWDRVSALYVRARGPNAAIATRFGFRVVRPAWFDFGYLDGVVASGLGRSALAELQVALARAPDNEEAWLQYAYVFYRLGARDAAADAMQRALDLNPDRAMTNSALGQIALERGDRVTARARFERALALDPGDFLAVQGLRGLGVPVNAPAPLPAGHP